MATYKGIKGFKVQSLASDPTVNEGQIWYNTTSNTLKYDAVGAGAWASATAINSARGSNMGAGISNTSALCFGGVPAPFSALTETFNGSTWTEVNDLNTGRGVAGSAGTQTAAICCGGSPYSDLTEKWDGSTWTEVATLNIGRGQGRSAGTSTASLYAGGWVPGANVLEVEFWDGTAWTEGADLNVAKANAGGAMSGTQTSTMVFGGNAPGVVDTNEEYNGTSWTEINDLNTGRRALMGTGTVTSALAYGGSTLPSPPGLTAITEQYNGTSWTEVADLATARMWAGCDGSGTSALCIGGESPGYFDIVESWDGAPAVVKTVTTS